MVWNFSHSLAKRRSEGKRGEENTSVLWKRWKMNQFPPLPPKLRPKSTRSTNLRIASHKDIFSPSFPFLSLTQKTYSINLFLRNGAETSQTPHPSRKQTDETCLGHTSMPYQALYKTFAVFYASRNLNLEKSTLTDQFISDSAIPIKDLLKP